MIMFYVKDDVIPGSMQIPAMEILQLSQQADFPFPFNQRLDFRNQHLVVRIMQFATQHEPDHPGFFAW